MNYPDFYRNYYLSISKLARALILLTIIAAVERGAAAQTTTLPAPPADKTRKVDPNRLEIIEELSESLANDLLELSVAARDRDLQLTAEFFPFEIVGKPFPSRPTPIKNQVKWVGAHDWEAKENAALKVSNKATGANKITRKTFLNDWSEFLAHFSDIEDARFKVKEANFDDTAKAVLGAEQPTAVVGATGKARIAFYVIGRDINGKREWARGAFNARVRYDANKHWQFDSIEMLSFDSLVAEKDLFSEVAIPAGVGATLPTYGTPENSGFVWRGAAAADFDDDGWIDLFVVGANRNFLYLNDRNGGFRDVSDEAGVKILASGTAPLVFDYDRDGDADIFISSVGQQILLRNNFKQTGKLEFDDVSLEAGVAKDAIGFSAVAGDVNGDGRLDVYVTSYNRYGQVTPDSWFRATNGTSNLLFISQPDGTFREEAQKWGVDDRRWSYAAEFADIDNDGKIDLYVTNDFGEKAMYINKGDRFVDEAKERGVLDPGNGMGVSFGDYNNDGRLDLHVSNMSSTAGNRILSRLFPNSSAEDNVLKKLAAGNNLFENTGDGKFKDVTAEVGGFSSGWAWGGGFIDFDNDGWEDIYTPNGFISGKSMKDT
ncbi:MAG TPA: VCBS repeat-containing protein [Pyrinomonadaceae bacterium]|nr:VCBS repeat-containing protein [Pyrinomonadaceae bacterium]